MKLNQAGINLIKQFEGIRLDAYKCSAGVWTIGYGTTRYHDGKPVKPGDKISQEQAEHLLKNDLEKFSQGVAKLVKIPLTENEFAALVSFAYNVGLGALEKSTLLRLLNAGASRLDVADQFLRWNRAGGVVLAGLTRRRQAESKLFLT